MKLGHFLPVFFLITLNYGILQAQWASLSGPSSTSQSIGALSVVNPDVVWGISWDFAGFTTPQYLVKTTDGGESWTVTQFDIPSDLYAIQLYAMDEMNAWLATADELDPISGKMFRTTDGGETWVEQSTGFTEFNETPAGVYFWDAEEGVAFGATCYENYNDQIAIYTTDDGGEHWEKVTGDAMPEQLPGEGMCLTEFNSFYDVQGDIVWFVSSLNRVFRSLDRGRSWTAYEVDYEGYTSAIAFKDEQNGIAVGIFPNGALRTTDGGVTWTPIDIPSTTHAAGIEYIPGTASTYIVHNGSAPVYNPAMFVTYDDGENWEEFTSNVELECMAFLSPTVGFGGGRELSLGAVYKWDGFSLVSGARQALAEAPLNLAPNPASAFLKVELPVTTPEVFHVQVMDAQGRLAIQEQIRNGELMDVATLPRGVYLVKAVVDGWVYTGRFVKQ